MDNSGWNAWVFRDGRKLVQGKWLLDGLTDSLRLLPVSIEKNGDRSEPLLTALLWSGELECALADAASPHAQESTRITDQLAAALIRGAPVQTSELLQLIERFSLPGEVPISVPESFAYYGLHPCRFAETVAHLKTAAQLRVVGIRSIGTTLSAVVLAALREKGVNASRITVRPVGHPYDRELELTAEQKSWTAAAPGADFLVVDEGPGLSGSSFLCTAEALERNGVPASRITLLGTRKAAANDLRAHDGVSRWKRFRNETVSNDPVLPEGAEAPLGGGGWRDRFLPADSRPGSWTQLEVLKFISADGRRFFRFEGYGRYGADVARRAQILAASGFCPRYHGRVLGFGCYDFVDGRPLGARDLTLQMVERLSDYCALRTRELRAEVERSSDLENMLRFNWKNEFGVDLGDEVRLEMVSPVVPDGRMLPQEWLLSNDGTICKVDAVTHGDDHFFPGPCDIAWDLAGAIIEWKIEGTLREAFLERYRQQTDDDVRPRLRGYMLAYSIFRCSYCKMAAKAMGRTPEESLLHRDYLHYREQCEIIFAVGEDQSSRSVAAGDAPVLGSQTAIPLNSAM